MQTNNGNIYLCKYRIETLVFMKGSERIIMDPSNVLSMEYLNDYEMNLRPVFKLSLRMDVRKKLWILKNKSSITAKFELCKIGLDINNLSEITAPGSLWNDTFGIYLNDDDNSSDIKILEESIKATEGDDFRLNDTLTENYFHSQNFLDVFLFNQSLINASNNVVNEVFTENTLQQIAAYVFSASKHKKVLMSPIENSEIYNELLLPANPAYKCILYLDQFYGLYKKGGILYYDMDICYLLNSSGRCTAKRSGEKPETILFISNINFATPGNGMMKADKQTSNYAMLNDDCFNVQKFSDTNNASSGSIARVIVSDDISVNVTDADSSVVSQRNENITYNRKGDNKYAANIIQARSEENEYAIFVTGNNLDISAFTPNKTYRFVFNETSKQEKYGQTRYRLAYAYHYFKIQTDSYLDSSHRFIFKKLSSDNEVITESSSPEEYTMI